MDAFLDTSQGQRIQFAHLTFYLFGGQGGVPG
jgi:hypothetical protein